MQNTTREQYNIITVKNIDDETFYFKVDGQPYSINGGETRNFPKFMANLAVKHLIDRLLIKKDQEGRLLSNKNERAALAEQIVVGEQDYAVAVVPTDQEIVEEINDSDIDSVLDRKKEETFIPAPQPDFQVQVTNDAGATTITADATITEEKPKKKSKKEEVKKKDEFVGLKVPPRAEMMKHAQYVLKMNIDDPKTKSGLAKLSDEELYLELGMHN